ncbi:platelet-activating factor acetylhydrolase 2, cytoplasmic-like isoform X2 [Oppia nitens]|nr:platelet-activating factor acetylhydrolase 2, cytoplasmic-like isoform X2 [Oppia nitens]
MPTGPLKIIGYRDIMTGFSKKGGVLVRLYYPAANQSKSIEEQHLIWPNWLPHENYSRGYGDVADIRWEPLFRFIQRLNGDIFIPAIPNAKPLREKGGKPYPVIVFSHGLGGCRTAYSSICLELASHGFIVAAVEHRDNTACLSFYAKQVRYSMRESNPNFFSETDGLMVDEPDFGDEIDDPNYIPPKALAAVSSVPHIAMEWVRFRNIPITKTGRKIYNFRNQQIHHRVRECSRALDLLEALQAGYELNNLLDPLFNISEFEGLIDLEKAIIMGHSMGGATALMSAGTELRFKVAVCLDAWMYPIKDECFDLVTQPILFINTENFIEMEANLNKMKELMTTTDNPIGSESSVAEDYRKAQSIRGAVHFNQCDIPFVFHWLTKLFIGQYGQRSKRNRFTAMDLSSYLALSFISKHLDIIIDEDVETYLSEQKKKFKPTFKK